VVIGAYTRVLAWSVASCTFVRLWGHGRELRLVAHSVPARAGDQRLNRSVFNSHLDPAAFDFDRLESTGRRFELELRAANLHAGIRGDDSKSLLRTEMRDGDMNPSLGQAYGFVGRCTHALVTSNPDRPHVTEGSGISYGEALRRGRARHRAVGARRDDDESREGRSGEQARSQRDRSTTPRAWKAG
jgi:hypothetical protein